jgi:hypothetical protein
VRFKASSCSRCESNLSNGAPDEGLPSARNVLLAYGTSPARPVCAPPPIDDTPTAAVLFTFPGNPALDASLPQNSTALIGIVALVGVKLTRTL